jgi:hypothetical protein
MTVLRIKFGSGMADGKFPPFINTKLSTGIEEETVLFSLSEGR